MDKTWIYVSFAAYFILVLGVGFYFVNKSKNMNDYFLGGRNLNSWVAALSAQASDMSGWLLMGLPAAAYISGVSAGWIAIGLGIGTYLNWLFVAKRLRNFTLVAGDAITIPEYLQNRFKDKSNVVSLVCAVIIFIFFLVYTASAFNAGGVLFSNIFEIDYTVALTIGALIIIVYTLMGGFSAVCWTDLFQGILMFVCVVGIPLYAMTVIKDFSFEAVAVTALADGKEGYFDLFKGTSFVDIASNLAWGLGYFGMPHILARFMAIKSSGMIKKSRIIAMIWVVFSLAAAVLTGVVGYMYMKTNGMEIFADAKAAEQIFMTMSQSLLPPLLAGVFLSAILAAIMSTADSQLLVTSSAVTNDIYKKFVRKDASDKELVWVSRIAVLVVAVIAYFIALNPENTVMNLVSYAWAGFGAAFGPVILLSIYWKRMTLKGAVSGIIIGGATIILWESFMAATGVYSLIPGFALGLIAVVVISLLDKEPDESVKSLFEAAISVQNDA